MPWCRALALAVLALEHVAEDGVPDPYEVEAALVLLRRRQKSARRKRAG